MQRDQQSHGTEGRNKDVESGGKILLRALQGAIIISIQY
jgi:hypothetical protein